MRRSMRLFSLLGIPDSSAPIHLLRLCAVASPPCHSVLSPHSRPSTDEQQQGHALILSSVCQPAVDNTHSKKKFSTWGWRGQEAIQDGKWRRFKLVCPSASRWQRALASRTNTSSWGALRPDPAAAPVVTMRWLDGRRSRTRHEMGGACESPLGVPQRD